MDVLPFLSLATKEDFSIGAVLIGVCIYLIVKAIKFAESRIEKHGDMKGLAKRKEANAAIYGMLLDRLANIGGERLLVFEFSNGTKTVAKIPYEYLSATYEATCLGKPSAANKMQNILTSLFSTFLLSLSGLPYLILHLANQDPKVPPSVYHYMNERNAAHSMNVPIVNPRTRQMIGIISWDVGSGWDGDGGSGFTEDAITQLRALSASIGAYLTFAKG